MKLRKIRQYNHFENIFGDAKGQVFFRGRENFKSMLVSVQVEVEISFTNQLLQSWQNSGFQVTFVKVSIFAKPSSIYRTGNFQNI